MTTIGFRLCYLYYSSLQIHITSYAISTPYQVNEYSFPGLPQSPASICIGLVPAELSHFIFFTLLMGSYFSDAHIWQTSSLRSPRDRSISCQYIMSITVYRLLCMTNRSNVCDFFFSCAVGTLRRCHIKLTISVLLGIGVQRVCRHSIGKANAYLCLVNKLTRESSHRVISCSSLIIS